MTGPSEALGQNSLFVPGTPMTPQEREQALANFYAAERRAGACPLVANERMMEFSKRLDREAEIKRVADDAFNRDLAIIRSCMERRS